MNVGLVRLLLSKDSLTVRTVRVHLWVSIGWGWGLQSILVSKPFLTFGFNRYSVK